MVPAAPNSGCRQHVSVCRDPRVPFDDRSGMPGLVIPKQSCSERPAQQWRISFLRDPLPSTWPRLARARVVVRCCEHRAAIESRRYSFPAFCRGFLSFSITPQTRVTMLQETRANPFTRAPTPGIRDAMILAGVLRARPSTRPERTDLTPCAPCTDRPIFRIGGAKALKWNGEIEQAEQAEARRQAKTGRV